MEHKRGDKYVYLLVIVVLILLLVASCGYPPLPPSETAPIGPLPTATIATINEGAVALQPAGRLDPPEPQPVYFVPAPAYSSWPAWRVTAEGVPYYSGGIACTAEQAEELAGAFAGHGASMETRHWAIYVASRESGCRYDAVHVGPTDNSHCLFQLNVKGGGPLSSTGILGQAGWTPESVKASFGACAEAGAYLWSVCGKGPWIRGDYGCRKPSD